MSKDVYPISAKPRSRYYVADALYLGAFLYAHGLWLHNAESDETGKHRFVFRDDVQCERLVWQFRRAPKAMVDARTYMYAIEELSDRSTRLRRIRRD